MKIAVSATDNKIDAAVDQRFGRCKYFLIVESENMNFNAISNESSMATGGAGIKAAETVVNNGAEALITGNIGPNAYRTLSAGGVKVFTGAKGSVSDAINSFKKGELEESISSNVGSHHGIG